MNIARITCYTNNVAHGLPSNDTTTKTTVSTGAVKLDFVQKSQYRYTYISDIINTGSGAVGTEMEA